MWSLIGHEPGCGAQEECVWTACALGHQGSFQFYLLSEFPFLMLMKGENPKLPPNIPTLLLHSILIHHLFWFKCKYIMFGHKQVRLLSRD